MILFKKHKSKDKLVLNVGIKECSTCDMNLRCEECVYQKENENIKSEIERLEIENQSLRSAANSYKLHYNKARAEAIKEFADRLKERQQTFIGDEYTYKFIYLIEIDNLVKEMVGDNK